MSGREEKPLPDRFRELKLSLVAGHEEQIQAGWKRLLKALRAENEIVASQGSKLIPEVDFSTLENDLSRLKAELKRRGAAVVRGVVPEQDARFYKAEIEDYVRKNPGTRGK